jgi:Ca2+-binding EF-hand superfamily protein
MCCKRYGTGAFALALAAVLVSGTTPSAQTRPNAPMRFAVMDRNGDGEIARSEWRGSDNSFEKHDWNGDGKLSGDEVRMRRRQPSRDTAFDSPYREYELDDWSAQSFEDLDHNRNGQLTGDEWHFDREAFRRADHNRDGAISRAEFLSEGGDDDDDIDDRFRDIDTNRDGRITRQEWHGSRSRFDALDGDRDGVVTRAEVLGDQPPADLFVSLDMNRDSVIGRQEWHWSARAFDQRDANRDGVISREEFFQEPSSRSQAYRAGHERGLIDGRAAGREERERNQPWDLEGQRELEAADAGYDPKSGTLAEYQAGYRDGFRRAYREGWDAAGRR